MKIILLSGGSGKRLWPVSNDSRSKQFLKVLKSETGELESMAQRVWKQLKAADLQHFTYVSTCKAQEEVVLSQFGSGTPLIIEPCRRDTFPAVALACTYLNTIMGMNPEEVVCVLPIDSYVENHYFQRIKALENIVLESSVDLALIGGKPTYPAEKYGYIIPDKKRGKMGEISYMTVSHFAEKPKIAQAKLFIQQGALWNYGVFAFKLQYLLTLLRGKGYPVEYEKLLKIYGQLPKISFDYEVVEKAQANRVVVYPYDEKWKDLGTWNTLTEEMEMKLYGRGIISEDCVNTHVMNELDIPITVIACSNIVVASSPQGILVSDKAASHKIKDLLKDEMERPMYEERGWGWYQVLNYAKYSDDHHVLTKKIVIEAGKNISYQYHRKRSEFWTVLEGDGEFVLNDRLHRVKPGDVLKIPQGDRHGIKAVSKLEIIEVQMGSELVEEDIIRLYISWEDVIQHLQP